MKFGPVPAAEAAGAIAAHSVRAGETVIRKGTRLTAAHVSALAGAGVGEIVVARLEAGEVHEDEAAHRLARVLAGAHVAAEQPFTGRANLTAGARGLLVVDRAAVDRINRIDPAITLATLPAFAPVEPGRMVATVKIIPFAVAADALRLAEATARRTPPLAVAPFRPLKVGLVATAVPTLKASVMDKTRRLLEERLAPAGARLVQEMRVAHDETAVGLAIAALDIQGCDLIVVFGGSAVVDARDVVPAGIVFAGGTVDHLGMPVDPGNLLVLGRLRDKPVIGAPGCARSPKENGFDWVLNRLLAGIAVTPDDITGMGVGGLLMEIVSRPQPRSGAGAAPAKPRVAAVVLAAGQSRRMGGPNKLLATIAGKPLVRHVAEAALASRAAPVTVVTGHMAGEVERALAGLDVFIVRNPDFADGLSTSLRTGIGSLDEETDAALILLADMPMITPGMIDRLIAAYRPDKAGVVVPTFEGRRGNPVLWSRRFFNELTDIAGDIGARHLIGANPEAVTEIELGPAAALDLDTPQALAAAGGKLPP